VTICQNELSKLTWPNGKKFAVCLTHDVDRVKKTYQYFTRFFRFLSRFQIMKAINEIKNSLVLLDKIENNPYWGFERLIELENQYGVKSTFFFLNEYGKVKLFDRQTWKLYLGRYSLKSPDIVKIIKRLDSDGFDIGLHGSYNSFLNKNLLKTEKYDLECVLGKEINGIRQHYLNLEIPKTWLIHEELGIKYDLTYGYRNRDVFDNTHYYPFFPFYKSSFLVIPLSIMDSDLTSNNIDLNDNVWEECVGMVNNVENIGGVLTLNWHQERCNDMEFANNFSLYEDILKMCLEKDAWIASAYDIYNWIISCRK